MKVAKILDTISTTRGSIAKSDILREHTSNEIFKTALKMGLDNFIPFNVVKVPKIESRLEFPLDEDAGWQEFFVVLDECASRVVTGNTAINRVYACFSSVLPEDEFWMRKILQKKLAIGVSTKTVNKIYPGLIPTFEVSLAQKFEPKRIDGLNAVFVEPKLDGIRCFAIVEDGKAKLYARSGKLISNFDDTIGSALATLGDGCYDGELMGEDFVSLMRQAYRKENVESEGTYLALFDFLPLEEWRTNETIMTSRDRYHELASRIFSRDESKYVKPVERYLVDANYDEIMKLHNAFVKNGYEGAMVKTVDSPYRFGRSYDIMKVKKFHDADLLIESIEEGTGRLSGCTGAVMVDYNGVKVNVGSGFSDEERIQIWNDKDSFIGRMIEVRYQEVTPDGSLRFPTFVCFRNDR